MWKFAWHLARKLRSRMLLSAGHDWKSHNIARLFILGSYQCTSGTKLLINRLEIDGFKGKVQFLADSRGSGAIREGLFACAEAGKCIVWARQAEGSWEVAWNLRDALEKDQRIARLFVGSRFVLVQTRNPVETKILDGDGAVLSSEPLGGRLWHGSQGVAEDGNGTVMFSEYQTGEESERPTLHVWRLKNDNHLVWERVLSVVCGKYPDGDIRHFHTCFADPARPGVWFVSSGDVREHNKVWQTVDCGDTWRVLRLEAENSEDFGIVDVDRLARFTSIVFSDGALVWATDDSLGVGASVLVRGELKEEEGILSVKILEKLGVNLSRNCVVGEGWGIVVSESKHDVSVVDLHVFDSSLKIRRRIQIPNIEEKQSPVTNSIGSLRLQDSKAYFPNIGVLDDVKGGLLELKLVDERGA